MKRLPALLPLILIALWGCAPADEGSSTEAAEPATDAAAADPAADLADARKFSEAWDPAYEAGDPDTMTAMFTDDAVRLLSDQPIQRGSEAIRAGFAASFETATFEPSNPILGIGVAGDWAWSHGTYTDKRTDNASGEVTEEVGKWVAILRRTADGWKYEVDCGNENAPGVPGEALAAMSLPPAEGITRGSAEEVDAVRAAIATWEAATEAQDIDALTAQYAEDGIQMNDAAPVVVGREAIRAGLEAAASPTQEASLTFDVVEVDGDWAWARGYWGISASVEGGASVHDQGKWLNVMKRTADGWKITLNVWNRDAPPPAGG